MESYEPELAVARLEELKSLLQHERLVDRLPEDYPPAKLVEPIWTSPPLQQASQQAQVQVLRSSKNAQYARNDVEQQRHGPDHG